MKKYAIVYNTGKVETCDSWNECKRRTHGVSGVRFKGFESDVEMNQWIHGQTSNTALSIDTVSRSKDYNCIYVDGSFQKHCNGYAGWGFVHMKADTIISQCNGLTPVLATSRNIDGEMYATLRALEYIKTQTIDQYIIVHDYLGISQWLLELWKNSKDTKYVNDCISLYKSLIISGYDIPFIHVRGHRDVKGNLIADQLATSAK